MALEDLKMPTLSCLGYMSTTRLSHLMGHSGQRAPSWSLCSVHQPHVSSFEAKESIVYPMSFTFQLSLSSPQPSPLQAEFQGL